MTTPLHILICEPVPAVAEALQSVFANDKVEVVETGRDAMLAASSCKPDYLLLDVFPEDTDAFEFLSRFRGSLENTRIIVLSPTHPDMLAEKLRMFNVSGVIRRSDEPAELLAQLKPYLPITWGTPQKNNKTIVYVGGSRAYSKLTEAATLQHKYDYYSVPSAADAQRLLRTILPTALVVDVEDCHSDIESLINTARSKNPAVQFTVLITGTQRQERARLTESGVRRILVKPCSLHALAGAIAADDSKQLSRDMSLPSVLVVEDSTETAEVIEAFFNASGCNITVAESAERALELLPRHRYHALLLDLGLPGMDGVELLARIRHSGMRIPCVVVTGSFDPDDRKLLSDLGIEALFEKPTDFGQVTKVVSGLLR